jgi:phosphoribosyl 1,2-cyclic phosphodiesterase
VRRPPHTLPESTAGKAPAAGGIQLCVLASGSRGNATFFSDGATRILIDAGLSGKEIERRLATHHIDPAALDGILVTHEHNDHIQGVGVLSRRFKLPVYISDATYAAAAHLLGKLHRRVPFCCGQGFAINQIAVHPFSTSHDAADPAGFTLQSNGCKIGFATDLGIITHMVRRHLQGCDALVLEANHDPEMLIDGPYPWPLKQRIKGRSGHLSNTDTRDLIRDLCHARLRHIIFAHLSEQNNTHRKLLGAVRAEVENNGISVTVARQEVCSRLIRVAQVLPESGEGAVAVFKREGSEKIGGK